MKLEISAMLANDSLKLNDAINIFLINSSSMLYQIMFFYKMFINIPNIANINSITMNRKTIHLSIYACFYAINIKSFEIFTKNNGYGFISESFACK